MDPSQTSLTALKGVGSRLAGRLERLGLRTVEDVLFHLPFRYQDRTRIVPLGSLRPGREALVRGRVDLSEVAYGRRRSLLSRISDGTGVLTLRFFHFSGAQQANLSRGRWVRCYGEARRGASTLEMIHPEYDLLEGDEPPAAEEHLTPVYPTTEGLHQLGIRRLVQQAVERDLDDLPELVPEDVLSELGLPGLRDALRYVHRPPPGAPVDALQDGRHPAQQRLAFEELLAHHLSLKRLRERKRAHDAPAMKVPGSLAARFVAALPFAPTRAQLRVIDEINADLEDGVPMQRLLQGDVGSGKTVVAAAAALRAVEAGYQVAVMAPTEILGEQHFRSFSEWLMPLGVATAWLSGRLPARERRRQLARMESGEAAVAMGTHALFQEGVRFADLGLVVVDEQHRFGVHQRLALREKGSGDGRHAHQLIMTATPIPRTLAMTAYADLDVSVLDELPPGRTPVETVVIPDSRRDEILARVSVACREGRQAYWVCPLVEESEALQARAAVETESALRAVLPDLSVGLVHGRMKSAEKDAAMQGFKAGRTQLLVATTVIEVGVDVPNASLMIIENSERLGLSQLHQLRGRVGRGANRSTCVLMYHAPLSEQAKLRLATLRETTDGFVVAQRDMELRGPGEVLGTRQTGLQMMRIADLLRDKALLPRVERAGSALLQRHPGSVDGLIRRWLGEAERYGDV
jgi:ATP-dependent DNA helicase RecG